MRWPWKSKAERHMEREELVDDMWRQINYLIEEGNPLNFPMETPWGEKHIFELNLMEVPKEDVRNWLIAKGLI